MKINKIKAYIVIFISVFLIVSVGVYMVSLYAPTETEKTYVQITVQENDTLWEIAEENNSNQDIRTTVLEICKSNGIKAENLKVGMKIFVPID